MAPSYKLYYFDVAGAGESIRFLLSYGNIDFEDVRIKKDDWRQHKSKMPFGVMPVLERDGKLYDQSISIARYVAKQVKLDGKNDWEDLEIDALVDTVRDLRQKFTQYRFEQDETKKKEQEKVIFGETIPYYFERFEAGAKRNNGYLVLDRLTWADVYFASVIDGVLHTSDFSKIIPILDNYVTLKALVDKVLAIPSIKKWIDTRPS